MRYPGNYGFIPQTLAEDGDPIDVLVISEFTGFPGCVMDCRIIGCIQIEQTTAKKKIRNDRFLAIPDQSVNFATIESI
jgi:inorganic pyrophosphatase